MLIGEILSNTANKFPDKPAVICGKDICSFADLEELSNRVANAIIRSGLGTGSVLGILSTNQFEYPGIFFGCAKSGCILAHMSTRFTDDELCNVITSSDVKALFVHEKFLETILRLAGNLTGLEKIIFFGNKKAYPPNVVHLEEFLIGAQSTPVSIKLNTDDAFGITYTGGTTGFPKGVVVSHRSRIIGSIRAQREMDISENDIICCSSPLFHIAGLFIWFQTGVLMGLTAVLMPAWDPEAFIDLVEKQKITAAFLVPTQINSIITSTLLDSDKLKSLRYVNYGAAPTSRAQLEKQLEVLPSVIWQEQYGQSEAGNLTVRPTEFNLSKSASVGKPYSDLELQIFGSDNNKVANGEVGEVVTRGDHVMLGYYREPDKTKEVFIGEGWLKTGDMGYLDEDGFLFLVDRSKDMIISGGENIFPTEIEEVLYNHPSINECAVFGVPDDHWGELPAAHIVLEKSKQLTVEEIDKYCIENMARHKRPRLIKFVEKLPKSAVGKIQKNIIRDEYWP